MDDYLLPAFGSAFLRDMTTSTFNATSRKCQIANSPVSRASAAALGSRIGNVAKARNLSGYRYLSVPKT